MDIYSPALENFLSQFSRSSKTLQVVLGVHLCGHLSTRLQTVFSRYCTHVCCCLHVVSITMLSHSYLFVVVILLQFFVSAFVDIDSLSMLYAKKAKR